MSLVLQKKKILLVDDDQSWGSALQKNLKGQHSLSLSDGLGDWLSRVDEQLYDVILLSSTQSKKLDAETLQRLKQRGDATRVLLVAESAEHETDWTEYPLIAIDNIVARPKNADDLVRIMNEDQPKPAVSLLYDPQLIASFTMATREIMQFYTQQYPQIGNVALTKDCDAQQDVTGLISFIGHSAKGTLSIDFDEGFFRRVGQTMLADENAASDPESLQDFAGEICNQVLGKVKRRLADEGIRLTASLPRVVTRRGKPVFDRLEHEIVRIPLVMDQSHCLLRFNML